YRNPSSQDTYSTSNYDIEQLAQGSPVINYYGNFSHSQLLAEDSQRDITGIYVQHQHNWGDAMESIAGVRFDQYSQIGSAVSPRLGFVLHPATNDSIKLLYGRAFRAPHADELYTDNNPLLRGNPGLKPETVDTVELIWLRQWQRNQFSVNYFYNRFEDAIGTEVSNGGRTYQNSAETESSQGMAFEFTGSVTSAVTTRLTATRLFDAPDSFFRESRYWLAAAATYTKAKGYGTVTLQYHSERENLLANTEEREVLDDYAEVNVRAGWLWQRDLETWVEARNLADEDSSVPANSGDIEGGVPNRGRELRVGMLWRY
ncbi:MAG TPA: TonB-dependent receptor, partial [Dongiaceae bacterium]|nr:TonB-dependent receptor [Dongiaceae bacterium]